MKKNLIKLILILTSCISAYAFAWSGIDAETKEKVRISSKRRFVRKGATIEIFDSKTFEYHNVEVDRITNEGDKLKFFVYDKDEGKDRIFLMENLSKKN